MPNDGSALAKDVLLDDGARATVAVPTLAADGGTSDPVAGARVTVETDGPVRTELLVRSRYADDLAWEARVAAFAGSPALRVQLTLTSLANRPYTRIRSFRLPVTAGDLATGFLGVGGAARAVGARRAPTPSSSCDFRDARLDGKPSDASGDGWARVAGERLTITAVRRWFGEEWPQALDVSAGARRRPPRGQGRDRRSRHRRGQDVRALARVPVAATASDPPSSWRRAPATPLVGHVDAAWTAASRRLPNAVAPTGPGVREPFLAARLRDRATLPRADRAERWDDGPPVDLRRAHERARARRASTARSTGATGTSPAIATSSEGCDAWGNLEYDLTQVLGLDFAAPATRRPGTRSSPPRATTATSTSSTTRPVTRTGSASIIRTR